VQLPAVNIRVQLPDGGNDLEATFRPVEITSVLPPDTSQVEPMPAKDVIGPSRLIWPLFVGAAVIAAMLLLGLWAWRRRRKPGSAGVAGTPPRDLALAQLERIRKLGYLERGEQKSFYSAVTDVLRGYTATVDRRLGTDLTTTELERELTTETETADTGPDGGRRLISVLGRADLVKFAGSRPATPEAEGVWSESRDWVVSFPPVVREPDPESDQANASEEAGNEEGRP
jgi:hypothetical protein